MSIIRDLLDSLNNKPTGFSARKLSAFAGVSVALYITIKITSNATVVDILLIWLCFALLCLGIVTVEQIIKFKSGISEKSVTKTTVEKEVTQTDKPETP